MLVRIDKCIKTFLLNNLKGRDYFKGPGLNGEKILKMILETYGVSALLGFIWLGIGTHSMLLWIYK
jgi:hypothetical protein